MGQTQLNELLKRNNAGRTFAPVEGSRWGELILPAPDEHRVRTDEGLKIVVLAAYNIGLSLLNGLLAYEKNWPGKIELLAVSTDEALLHKSGFDRSAPFPGQTYSTGRVTGIPSAV